MTLPQKYVVLRKTEFGQPDSYLEPGAFFVLRCSDVFAAAALFAYANTIQNLLEIEAMPAHGGTLSESDVERLTQLCDGAHDLAVEWSRRQDRKLPS